MISHKISEIGVANSSSAWSVHASDDCKHFSLSGAAALITKEEAQVVGIIGSFIVSVDGLEGGIWWKIVADLEISLEGVKASDKLNLLLDDGSYLSLNVKGESLIASNAADCALSGYSSQIIIFTRQE